MSKRVSHILSSSLSRLVKPRRFFVVCTLLLPFNPFAFCLFAYSPSDSHTSDSISRSYDLDEISVVAKHESDAVTLPQSLHGEQLQSLSAHSVADALRYFSGVQIKDYGGVGGIKTVDLRSMGSHHVGVFYDGIEVGNAQNGVVDLGKFSLENIESIALFNGQKTESLQPAKDFGSAGTIYIRTRKPVFSPDKPYNVQVGMKAGSFGLANPSVLYEHKICDAVHLSANAEYTFATGRYRFNISQYYPNGTLAWDTTGIRQNGDIQSFRGEMGVFGYLSQGKWHLKGYYYQSEKGIPRAIVRHVWTSSQRQWDRNAFVQGSFQYRVAKRWEWLFSAKYANDKMRYLNPDTTLMYVDNTFLQQEAYVSWANRVEVFDWWNVSVSGDYIFNTLSSNMPNFAYPTRHTGLTALATTFHYQWIQAQASVLGNFVHDELGRMNDGTKTLNHQGNRLSNNSTFHVQSRFTPAVFLSYQPLLQEQWFIRAFYKQIFRMPTFNDLYYTDIGNIALKPEETRQYDVSVEYSKNFQLSKPDDFSNLSTFHFQLKADGYFNQVKNKIVAIPKGNSQYRWMMMNVGYVEIRGIDLSPSFNFQFSTFHFGLSANYSYQKAQDLTDPNDPVTYGGQIAYIPWHSCSARGDLSWRGLRFNYSFIYVGKRYHNSANIPANYEQPWYTHDLALGYRLPLSPLASRPSPLASRLSPFDSRPSTLDFSLEINNLFNQQYEIIHNYPMPGIHGKLSIKFIF